MRETEIPGRSWADFAHRFNRAHAGCCVDVEVYDPVHGEVEPSAPRCDLELRGQRLECVLVDEDRVSILTLGHPSVQVRWPQRMLLHQIEHDLDEALEIRTTSGKDVYVRLRPPHRGHPMEEGLETPVPSMADEEDLLAALPRPEPALETPVEEEARALPPLPPSIEIDEAARAEAGWLTP
jgi:hypothetical protein